MDQELRDLQDNVEAFRRFVSKLVILGTLFVGAVSPVARNEWYADYIGVACSLVLTVIAGFTVFSPRKK